MLLPAGDSSQLDYSVGERLLHRMALGMPWISRASFDIDGLLLNKHQESTQGRHVFICGLARAGTTILMRTFYQTGQFRSLTYRDMPFVLMPRIWHQVARVSQKKGTLQQRAHGDGITIDYDSPEAFEEVFWRIYAGRNYLLEDRLIPHVASENLIRRFRLYVDRILWATSDFEQNRYLSKNNNNILRLSSIQKAFPDSITIVPYRNPIQQSASLCEQHHRFCARHQSDKFSYDYMRWLGHHEFGLTHKPFHFAADEVGFTGTHKPDSINYWLSLWNRTYRYLMNKAPNNTVFICYEALCKRPGETLGYLFELTGISPQAGRGNLDFIPPRERTVVALDESLEREGQIIYDGLKTRNNYFT